MEASTIGALLLSVASSVSIVICNKALMSLFMFNFGTTLTSWHLVVTFCSLHLARVLNLFEHQPVDMKTIVVFGLINGSSIGFLNLSLGFNSVGFYQMTKLAIIPVTVFLQTVFLKMHFSNNIKFSLLILLAGVGFATVTDLELNLVGSILSALAILTTCIGQILTSTIQKEHKISSTQLLYQSCPFMALILVITGPFLDFFLTKQNVFTFDYNANVIIFIILSCLIAVAVNFSTFMVIGKTSPVTYQVLGHLKTCLVLAMGFILLNNPFSWRNLSGMTMALLGMVTYSYVQIQEGRAKEAAAMAVKLEQSGEKNEESSVPLVAANRGDVEA
eukprot:TRINITY_DN2357_c0_g1_i2.p1 TRINITY_DN2357_c0_g1~~TRINITY_DN2357_c0_g1_i2.p1  ORF type:complete len:345 (+),score=70.88 TRINITY_DN2357_c0_g1_i2:42-1037(+)